MSEQKDIPIDELHVDPVNVRPVDRESGEPIPDLDSRHGLYPDVKDEGVLQPLGVRPHDGEYGVVIGSRRFAAAKAAGLKEVPCVVREDLEGDDEKARLESLKENLHRTDIPDWKKKELIQEMYDETDGRKSRSKRIREVMNLLNLGKRTVYKYLDISENLDSTLISRLKNAAERSKEEREQLKGVLSEKGVRTNTEGEGFDLEKEKAEGFPSLEKIPVEVANILSKSEFFLELQEEDLAKAHKLATEAMDVGQRQAGELLKNEKRELKEENNERKQKRSTPRGHRLTITLKDRDYKLLQDYADFKDLPAIDQVAGNIVRQFLYDDVKGDPKITSIK